MKFYLAMSTLDMVNIIYLKLNYQELLYLNIQSWKFKLGIGKSTEAWRQLIICQNTTIKPTIIWLLYTNQANSLIMYNFFPNVDI